MGDSLKGGRHASRSRVWRPHFGLRGLLLLMIICSLAATAASYVVRAQRGGGRGSQLVFLLLVLISPVALLVVVSLMRRWAEYRDGRLRHRPQDVDDRWGPRGGN
jgi:hypothetical protein